MSVPSLPARVVPKKDAEHRRAAHQAIGWSAVGLALTGGVELAIAELTHSVGLLGDAIHNLSDVSTSAVVLLGFMVSRKQASRRYPYGFERAEDLAGLGVALVVWASAVFAGIESYHKLVSHGVTDHLGWGMLGAVAGIVGNQIVAFYKRRVGTRIHSTTLLADAKHSWLDAISSLGALFGLFAVWFGFRLGDPIAGFFITVFIMHVGYEVTTVVFHHLMDGVEPEIIEVARETASNSAGVPVPIARGRWLGRSLVIELEPIFSSDASLGDVDVACRQIEKVVLATIEEATTVIVRPSISHH
ncbi:MAG: cation diffusion facilitator family transporter [Acidimicrobiales bacterium]